MFTGIVQAKGLIREIKDRGDALSMLVESTGFFKNNHVGDSIANDGVCLTVESCTENEAVFCLIRQTVANTAFGKRKAGDHVNLEQPCRPDSFMGGHFVMGHVDACATVLEVVPRETGVEVDLEIPETLRKYIIRRGSITLNGISLTVADKFEDKIRVAIIPETLEKTNLAAWKPGDPVNVEVDMIGKYIENYLKEIEIAR